MQEVKGQAWPTVPPPCPTQSSSGFLIHHAAQWLPGSLLVHHRLNRTPSQAHQPARACMCTGCTPTTHIHPPAPRLHPHMHAAPIWRGSHRGVRRGPHRHQHQVRQERAHAHRTAHPADEALLGFVAKHDLAATRLRAVCAGRHCHHQQLHLSGEGLCAASSACERARTVLACTS